jgi:hypothetical protein
LARKRIYQVARELNLSSEALLEMLRGMDLKVKSHMSAIEDETVAALGEKLRLEKEEVKKDEARKKLIVKEAEVKEKPPEKAVVPPRRVSLRRPSGRPLRGLRARRPGGISASSRRRRVSPGKRPRSLR